MEIKQSEITVAGNAYRCGQLNAMQQFHIVRRLGPMLVVAGVGVDMLQKGMKADLDDMVAMAGPVMEMLSRMKDEDVDYVLLTCMSKAQRQQGSTWAPCTTPDGKMLTFQDLDMVAMTRIVLEVLKLNLANFSTGLIGGLNSTSSSSGSVQPTTGTGSP